MSNAQNDIHNRLKAAAPDQKCIHGKTLSTCPDCYKSTPTDALPSDIVPLCPNCATALKETEAAGIFTCPKCSSLSPSTLKQV